MHTGLQLVTRSNTIFTDECRHKVPQQYIIPESISDQDGKYQFLLPPYIKGYNLGLKKWFEISTDSISNVK